MPYSTQCHWTFSRSCLMGWVNWQRTDWEQTWQDMRTHSWLFEVLACLPILAYTEKLWFFLSLASICSYKKREETGIIKHCSVLGFLFESFSSVFFRQLRPAFCDAWHPQILVAAWCNKSTKSKSNRDISNTQEIKLRITESLRMTFKIESSCKHNTGKCTTKPCS